MKKKPIKWAAVAWTPFRQVPIDPADYPGGHAPLAIFVNSRYQVSVFAGGTPPPFGEIAHLSIKTHDRAAYHDWRDLQRIKNEVCGPEYDAVEIYPAESKLVDSANQYHLFVFRAYRIPFGFQTRLVAEGTWQQSKQRGFAPGQRPDDCLTPEEFDRLAADHGIPSAED